MMTTLQQSLSSLVAQGLHFHQRGDLASAEQIYRTVLLREPSNADALHLMGSVRGRQGQTEEAIRLIEQAITASPRVSVYHNNLGNLKAAAGDAADAEDAYRRAIRLDRANADAQLNLAKLLHAQARLREAKACLFASLRLAPRSVEAHMLLGVLEESDGRLAQSLQSFNNAVRIDPNFAPGHFAIGNVQSRLGSLKKAEQSFHSAIAIDPLYADALYNLAHNLQTQKKPADAVDVYRRAIRLCQRNDAEVYNNYGSALSDLGQHAEAEAAFRRAIEINPRFDVAYFNLGRELTTFGDTNAGIAMLKRAIEINPRNPSAFLQLGTVYHTRGFLQDAIEANRKSIELDGSCQITRKNLGLVLAVAGDTEGLDILESMVRELPESPDLHWARAVSLLLHGRYDDGWPEYEWRMQVEEMRSQHRTFNVPRWTGEPLQGQRLLLYTEQGFGDTLQFARYAMLAAARGATIVLEVQPGLKRWCSALPGVTECVAQGEVPPAFDFFAPLMSLPFILKSGGTIPLPVSPSFEQHPAARVSSIGKLHVGIVWAGNPNHVLDRLRSTRLAEWSRLANIPETKFTSLQVGDASAQIDEGNHGFDFVTDCRAVRDFGDTAAAIAQLDLVITVDTAVAHLAGSMGKPVWILLYNVVDWRWGLHSDRTPWYSGARLFRQKTPGEWSGVFAELDANLSALVAASGCV